MASELLHREIQDAVSRLSGLLKALMLSTGCDPAKPQVVHRKYGIDRVLCWKVSRIVKSPSPEEALRQLPGEESFAIFTAAAERAGAQPADAAGALHAALQLYKAIEVHVGDKATLELMLDGVGRDGLMVSRKLAFRGNSGVLGVQARSRVQMHLIAPSAAGAGRYDVATAAGWVDFRRLRPQVPWPLHRRRPSDDPAVAAIEPLGDTAGSLPLLLPQFSANMPALETSEDGEHVVYELGRSAAGSTGAFSVFTGFVERGIAPTPGEAGAPAGTRFGANVPAPVEQLVIDVLVHREVARAREIEAALYSAAFNDGRQQDRFTRLPIDMVRESLGRPPLLAGAHAPQLQELAGFLADHLGQPLDAFAATRLVVEYPPIPCVASVGLEFV
ncbi:MAG: hypothetical protein JO224_02790 [Pelomonas sp.]|nr:hypothetical protein [Roseateles sp.]